MSDLAAVRRAVSTARPRGGQWTAIVAIDGLGSSGKSTLAAHILAIRGEHTNRIAEEPGRSPML
ncbi:MAG TPA: hypothetical protein VGF80_00055 [Galbitalea sp.]|jgi:hypothetical protein